MIAAAVCALASGGCAGLRCPRIDPSGERLFIWPQDQPAATVPFAGNQPGQAVYTDPVFPPTAAVQPGGSVAVQPPGDRLTITPERVLAPVGSEVILKSGICTAENFLLTDAKIEWLLASDSAGEFVALGGRGLLRKPLLPWNKPKKIDNNYAVGYSATVPLRITRGTADLTDDVEVEPGEAWASITSAVEGTTHVTAVAPEVVEWKARRASATIYWVDVSWTFPPPVTEASGSHVLTSTVRRQTDGTPLAGWIVRYEVADGVLNGGSTEQVVEVPTDASGQASIDVTPTSSAGTATRINIQVVRPERFAGSDAPRLVVANGSTAISWTDGTPYMPPADEFGPATPDFGDSGLGGSFPGTVAPPPVGAPQLEVEVRGDSRGEVGGRAAYEIVVSNRGNATATNVQVVDRFDKGLSNEFDTLGSNEIRPPLTRNLLPQESFTLPIEFTINRAGTLCHDVSVVCDEGAKAERRTCLTAVTEQALPQPRVTVSINAPRQRTVNETALFTLTLQNTGEVPLTNVEIVDEFDAALQPRPLEQGYELRGNSIVWQLPRLGVGETKRLDVECTCLAAALSACSRVQVTADAGAAGFVPTAEEHCLEILAARNVTPPNAAPPLGGNLGDDVLPGGGALPPGMQLDVIPFSNPVRVGQVARFQVVVRNNSTVRDGQVELRVAFPAGLTPDAANVRNDANVRATLVGNELRFDPIIEVRENERITFDLQATVSGQGVGDVAAKVISRRQPQPAQDTERIEMIR
jgi:uncharacterized repeat protein (TIGR01451 family)